MTKVKNKELDQVIEKIKKQTKDPDAIMRLGDGKKKMKDIEVISTGSLALNTAIGIGGVPKGRIVEIYGPESSGKTTLTLHIIAEAQKSGGNAAFIDVEHALDPVYAEKIGVDVQNLLISQPDTGEQALEITESLVKSCKLDVLVIDSVAALVPKAEIDGTMGDSHMGLQARLMSQAMRKLTGIVSKSKTCVIFINQIRHKIGIMFGNPETTTGGNALKFYSSLRLEIRRKSQIKDGDSIVGNRTVVKVAKNKLAPPFQKVEFDILYGQGISYEGDLIEKAIEANALVQSGSWFSYKENKVAQGKENLRQKLKEDKKLRSELENDIKGYLGL
ncbi:MAG: recombinase RecA [Candidatus Marinimicrobia bacterium]|nr:recombinase RecA [Candidatus Neomarinimicrobiota bacterium]|tara:strand:- start:34568 stop:35563 length:996 start_codon:yes stop_codon:yes gene_type:complete